MTLSNHLLANQSLPFQADPPNKKPDYCAGLPQPVWGIHSESIKTISQLPSIEGEQEFTTESLASDIQSSMVLQNSYKVISTIAVKAESMPIH
jgi:hypothetical protein